MQRARWFGYRKGYKLLQRIWITDDALRKIKALAKIDMDLKHEVEMFMERGISPSKFGPKLGTNAMKAQRHLYDHIVYDSTNERDFAADLDTNTDAAV